MPFVSAAPLAQALDRVTQYLYDVDGRLGEKAWELQIAIEDLAAGKVVPAAKGQDLIAFWRSQGETVGKLPPELGGSIQQSLSLLGQMMAGQSSASTGGKKETTPEEKQKAEASVAQQASTDPFAAQLATLNEPELKQLKSTVSAPQAQVKIQQVQEARDAGAGPIADPKLSPDGQAAGYQYKKQQGALFVDGASMSDVRQGALGDCYLMASMAAVADKKPGKINEMITDNGDGTYIVKLTDPETGGVVNVPVDADLATTKEGKIAYGHSTQQGELWVSLIEKAYAQHFKGNDYGKAKGGHEWHAMSAISGNQNKTYDLGDANQRSKAVGAMRTATQEGMPMVAASKSSDPDLEQLGLYPGHGYTVISATRSSVRLRNPHADADHDGKRGNEFELAIGDFTRCFERLCVEINKPLEPESELNF